MNCAIGSKSKVIALVEPEIKLPHLGFPIEVKRTVCRKYHNMGEWSGFKSFEPARMLIW
jgi:hypothetical protein